MAVVDDLMTAKANVAALIAQVTASPAPSYSVNGVSVSAESYLAMLVQRAKDLNDLIQVEGGPLEVVTQGVT